MENSLILSFFYNLILRIVELYNYSYTHKLLVSVSAKFKRFFSDSVIWNYVKSYERTSRHFEQSMFLTLVQRFIDWFIKLFRRLACTIREPIKNSRVCNLIENSIAAKLYGFLMEHFVIIISMFIFLHSVIPYQYWHNEYGAALIIFIAFLYIIKSSCDIRYGLDIKKLDFALVLFIISIIIAALTSITPASSMKFLVFNGMSFLLILIMVNAVKKKEELGHLLYWIVGAVTVTCFLGFWQYAMGIPVDPLLVDVRFGAVGRVYSSMGNPNNYAEFLILAMPFLAAAFFNAKNVYMRLVIAILAILPLVSLVLTLSRGAWIGFVVTAFIFIFLKNRKLIPIFAILGVGAIPFLPSSIIARLSTIGKDTSSLTRLPIWKTSWRIVQDYWMTGLGLGPEPFRLIYSKYTYNMVPAHSHMLPLQVWAEVGILGILSLVWMVARLAKKSMICVFEKRDEYLNNIIIAGISALAGILVVGFIEYVWFYERILTMFWIDVGILLVALNLQNIKSGIPFLRD